jgi:serine/threonine protein kinase
LAVNDQLKLASDGICRAGEPVSDPGKPGVYDPPEMAGGVRSRAADVWSLGMTLVEVLTQRLPSWNANDQADPVLPEDLPTQFLDIVRGCLRRDPQHRRITVTTARFHEGPPQQMARSAAVEPSLQTPAVKSKGRPWVWRTAFPLVVAILGIAALLAGFGLLRHNPETPPEVPVPVVKSEQTPEPQKPSPGRPSPKTQQGPGSAGNLQAIPAQQTMTPQPASLRSEVRVPVGAPGASVSNPETWVTERTGYMGDNLGPNGLSSGSSTRVSRSK